MTSDPARFEERLSGGRQAHIRADIQGLRAVAVMLVVAHHAGVPLPGGFVGVDVFFVISGYVITGLIVRELTRTDRFDWKRFYRRRILRLMPALAVMTTATAAAAILLLSPLGIQQKSAVAGGGAILWASNVVLYLIDADYFSDLVEDNPFLHTWSLGVEEQFYLMFPVLITGSWILARRRGWKPIRTLMLGITILVTASFALSLATSFGRTPSAIPEPTLFAFYLSPTRAWEFGVGALIVSLPAARIESLSARLTQAVGASAIVISSVWISNADPFPGLVALVPVMGCALLIWAGPSTTPIARVLAHRWPVYVGDISYSWYLWHWPLIVFAHRLFPNDLLILIVAVALSFVIAAASYRYIEERFREHGPERKPVLKPFVIALMVPGAITALLLGGSLVNWGNPSVTRAADQLLERPVGYRSCLSDIPVSSRRLGGCTWNEASGGKPIYLMGDSNAQQYTEALVAVGVQSGRPVTVATWGGCALVKVNYIVGDEPLKAQECDTYVRDTLRWLGSQPDATVVMASANVGITSDQVRLARTDGSPAATTATAKAALWRQGIVDVVRTLRRDGHEPILINVIPQFTGGDRPWWHPTQCQNWTLLSDPAGCGVSMPLEDVRADQELAFAAETNAAESTGTPIVDLRPVLCPEDLCRTFHNGTWVYRDGLHISPTESRNLGNLFGKALQSAS